MRVLLRHFHCFSAVDAGLLAQGHVPAGDVKRSASWTSASRRQQLHAAAARAPRSRREAALFAAMRLSQMRLAHCCRRRRKLDIYAGLVPFFLDHGA